MFLFFKFYDGKLAVKVDGIDHDQTVDLIFETLAQIKLDANWSFVVGRHL